MGNVITLDTAGDEREDAMDRARSLRTQADWCIEMAAKAFTPVIFQKYVDLAAAYQREAVEIERTLAPPEV